MKKMISSLVPLLAALTLAVLPSPAAAQWFWQNPLPVGDAIGHVRFVSATEGWATTSGGRILHTTNGGVSWSSQDPEPGETFRFIEGVGPGISFLDASNGWVIATRGTFEEPQGAALYKTTNGGASWQILNTGTTSTPEVVLVKRMPAR